MHRAARRALRTRALGAYRNAAESAIRGWRAGDNATQHDIGMLVDEARITCPRHGPLSQGLILHASRLRGMGGAGGQTGARGGSDRKPLERTGWLIAPSMPGA
jgi:hypothetical protein